MEIQNYIAPEVEVMEVAIEKGFALSDIEHYGPADDNGGWM